MQSILNERWNSFYLETFHNKIWWAFTFTDGVNINEVGTISVLFCIVLIYMDNRTIDIYTTIGVSKFVTEWTASNATQVLKFSIIRRGWKECLSKSPKILNFSETQNTFSFEYIYSSCKALKLFQLRWFICTRIFSKLKRIHFLFICYDEHVPRHHKAWDIFSWLCFKVSFVIHFLSELASLNPFYRNL